MNNSDKQKIDEIDAKGAKRVKGMPQVLSISLILVTLVMIAALAIYMS